MSYRPEYIMLTYYKCDSPGFRTAGCYNNDWNEIESAILTELKVNNGMEWIDVFKKIDKNLWQRIQTYGAVAYDLPEQVYYSLFNEEYCREGSIMYIKED